jgi:hypothetical protein
MGLTEPKEKVDISQSLGWPLCAHKTTPSVDENMGRSDPCARSVEV